MPTCLGSENQNRYTQREQQAAVLRATRTNRWAHHVQAIGDRQSSYQVNNQRQLLPAGPSNHAVVDTLVRIDRLRRARRGSPKLPQQLPQQQALELLKGVSRRPTIYNNIPNFPIPFSAHKAQPVHLSSNQSFNRFKRITESRTQ